MGLKETDIYNTMIGEEVIFISPCCCLVGRKSAKRITNTSPSQQPEGADAD